MTFMRIAGGAKNPLEGNLAVKTAETLVDVGENGILKILTE